MPVAYNIHPSYAVDDETLLETDLTTCHLLVLIGKGTFSYAVFDPAIQKFLALKSYSYQPQKMAIADLEMIEQVFDVDKLLLTAFKSVLLAFDTPECSLIPETHYVPRLKKDYLHAVHQEKLQEAVLADIMPALSIVNVFAVDKDLLGFLRKEFSTDRIIHAHTALLQSYPMDLDYQSGDGVAFVEVQRNRFTLTVYTSGNLLIQQQHEYEEGLDIVYHLVNTLRQLGVDEQKIKVKLSGALATDSQVYQEVFKFIPRLEWTQRLSGFKYITQMQEIPGYYFHNLYALALCV